MDAVGKKEMSDLPKDPVVPSAAEQAEFIRFFSLMQSRINKCADERWPGRVVHPMEQLTLIHREISDASREIYRRTPSIHDLDCSQETEELADAVITIMDLAETLNLPLAYAIVAKHKFNAGRRRGPDTGPNTQKA
jgi:hypothetical protein